MNLSPAVIAVIESIWSCIIFCFSSLKILTCSSIFASNSFAKFTSSLSFKSSALIA